MKKRILVISHLFPNFAQPNYGVFIFDQILELIKNKDLRFLVVAPLPYVPWPLNLFCKKWSDYKKADLFENYKGIKVVHPRYLSLPKNIFFSWSWLFIYLSLRYGKVFKEISEFNPDIVHSHCILPDGMAGINLSKKLRARTLVTVHGSDINLYPKRSRLAKTFSKMVLEQAEHLIAVSRNVKEEITKLWPNNKTSTIFVGYNDKLFKEVVNHFSREIVFVGRLIRQKGIFDLIDIFSKLKIDYPDLKLKIIGDGEDAQELKKYIEKLGLKDIKLLGEVNHLQIAEKISRSSLFVFPSYIEGLPVALIEAMAMGKLAVVKNFEGVKNIISDKKNGLIFSNNQQAVKKISEVLKNRKLFDELGKSAAVSVRDLSTKETTRELKKIYDGMRRRVCVVTTAHPSYDIRIYHKQIKTLASNGYDVIYIGPGGESQNCQNITFVEVKTPKFILARFLKSYFIYCSVKKQKAKVCHFHDPDFIPWGLILKCKGMLVVYDVHELYDEVISTRDDKSRLMRLVLRKFINFFEKKASHKFNLIICAWPKIAHKFDKKKTIVLNNYPILGYFKKNTITKHNKRFVYAGNLSEARGTLELINAALKVKRKDFRLYLIGRFTDTKFKKTVDPKLKSKKY